MIAVIFELEPQPGLAPAYLARAEQLRPRLEACDGFVGVERFQSLTRPGRYLSLSLWRDEAAVRTWRCDAGHRQAQQLGSSTLLADYRLRVAAVVRDYGLHNRTAAPPDAPAAWV